MRQPHAPQNQPYRLFRASDVHSVLRGSPLTKANDDSTMVAARTKALPVIF
jgi:hypothetical protein